MISFNSAYSGSFDNATSTCSVSCHSNQVWGSSGPLACIACHTTPTSAKHAKHMNTQAASFSGAMQCTTCHNTYYSNANHMDGSDQTSGLVTFDATYGGTYTDGSPGSCSTMGCHNNANWDASATLGCTDCHAAAYTSYYKDVQGKHISRTEHNSGCSTTCHANFTTHLDGVMDTNEDVKVNLIDLAPATGLQWDDATNGCSKSATGCHTGSGVKTWTY